MTRLRRVGAGLLALLVPAVGVAQPAPAPPASVSEEEPYKIPPLRFSAVEVFLDAVEIDREAASAIDAFWLPAIEAFVAANPGDATRARSFASQRRAAELAQYRPLVAMLVDRNAVEVLYPSVRRALEALLARSNAEYARTRSFSAERDREFAVEATRIRGPAEKRLNADLLALAALARTGDGAALRELLRHGYSWCAVAPDEPVDAGLKEICARLDPSPALQRLRQHEGGEKLILLNASAYGQLMAMVSMAHDPGISLHLLLPPEKVRAAGLSVPANLSFEELLPRRVPSTGSGG